VIELYNTSQKPYHHISIKNTFRTVYFMTVLLVNGAIAEEVSHYLLTVLT